MISEREKQKRFEIAKILAHEHLPKQVRDLALTCVENGYMNGLPVVVMGEQDDPIFGEEDLKVIASGDTTQIVCVVRGVLQDEWFNTTAPEFLTACRGCIYLQEPVPPPEAANLNHASGDKWWKNIGTINLDDSDET